MLKILVLCFFDRDSDFIRAAIPITFANKLFVHLPKYLISPFLVDGKIHDVGIMLAFFFFLTNFA